MPEKKINLIYIPQHQLFIQPEVTAGISWASDGSSCALEMFRALGSLAAA